MKTQENDVEDSFGEDREVSQARRIRDQVFQTQVFGRSECKKEGSRPIKSQARCSAGTDLSQPSQYLKA